MKTLIGMRLFTLEIEEYVRESHNEKRACELMFNYANFLSRQPQLGDFIACGEDGMPLDKKQFYYTEKGLKQLSGIELDIALSINKESEAYQQALGRVLFKGWKVLRKSSSRIFIESSKHEVICFSDNDKMDYNGVDITTLEHLTPYNLELTEKLIKDLEI